MLHSIVSPQVGVTCDNPATGEIGNRDSGEDGISQTSHYFLQDSVILIESFVCECSVACLVESK